MEEKNFLKFPSVIKEKISRGELVFSENVCFEYEPILAYRGVERNEDDFSAISRADFMSYAEMNICRRGINKKDPHYFGVSLFLNKESVENALKFPRPNKKISVGHVYAEAGPAEVNESTGHVCWWLYENIEVEGFRFV